MHTKLLKALACCVWLSCLLPICAAQAIDPVEQARVDRALAVAGTSLPGYRLHLLEGAVKTVIAQFGGLPAHKQEPVRRYLAGRLQTILADLNSCHFHRGKKITTKYANYLFSAMRLVAPYHSPELAAELANTILTVTDNRTVMAALALLVDLSEAYPLVFVPRLEQDGLNQQVLDHLHLLRPAFVHRFETTRGHSPRVHAQRLLQQLDRGIAFLQPLVPPVTLSFERALVSRLAGSDAPAAERALGVLERIRLLDPDTTDELETLLSENGPLPQRLRRRVLEVVSRQAQIRVTRLLELLPQAEADALKLLQDCRTLMEKWSLPRP